MKIIKRAMVTFALLIVAAAATVAGIGWHQGYRLYILHTGSMSPTLRPGDAVLDAPAAGAVHPGEVVTFRYPSGPDSVVTHRVVSYADGIVQTKGDANRTVDPWTLHLSQIVGRAAAFLPRAGYLLVYLKQPQGLASIATVALGAALLWQMFFPPETPLEDPDPAAAPDRTGGRRRARSTLPRHRRRRPRRVAV